VERFTPNQRAICLKTHTASQGLKIGTPRPAKSFTFRGDYREVMLKGGCGNHAVCRVEGVPFNWH